MQCNAMQCNGMQCNTMQCNALQCNTKQNNTIQVYSWREDNKWNKIHHEKETRDLPYGVL